MSNKKLTMYMINFIHFIPPFTAKIKIQEITNVRWFISSSPLSNQRIEKKKKSNEFVNVQTVCLPNGICDKKKKAD